MNDKAIYKEHALKDGHILQIFQDTQAESPRSWDNLGTMAIFHRKYNFGDPTDFSSDDFPGWAAMEDHIKTELKSAVCIPIYLYDHGGITINTQGFSSPWDSGQVGFIYVTEKKLKDTYGEKDLTDTDIEKAKASLEGEVTIMNRYIMGDVYGFHVIKRELEKEDQIMDSCSGFYGEDIASNGMLDHVQEELLPEDLTP
jgi:hypothetical protein